MFMVIHNKWIDRWKVWAVIGPFKDEFEALAYADKKK